MCKSENMIPSDKFDKEAIKRLGVALDHEVLENAKELLSWLQDCNWPVFPGIVERLSALGEDLFTPVSEILAGQDSIWKENIIGHLIPKFSERAQRLYSDQLNEILQNPTGSDFQEGVVDFIEIQLSNVKKHT